MTLSKTRRERQRRFAAIDLYVVTCEELSNGRSDLEVLDAVVRGGGRIIQLRNKQIARRDLFALAKKFRETTARAGVLLIINDAIDVALAVDADGVHLGQDDLPLEAARRIAPDMLIGISTHNVAQAKAACAGGADYINIGPVFPTGTKEHLETFLGPEGIREISPHVTAPFTVMGGIKESNIDQVLDAGARRVALVTAVTQAPDMAEAVRALRAKIHSHQKAS